MQIRDRKTIEIDGLEYISEITENDLSILIQNSLTDIEHGKIVENIRNENYTYIGIRKSLYDYNFYLFFIKNSEVNDTEEVEED